MFINSFVSAILVVLVAGGCEQAWTSKATVLGRWIETPESLRVKWQNDPYSHEVELFKDGTGASILRNQEYMSGPHVVRAGEVTESFTWSLSDDGKRIKTETQVRGQAPGVRRVVVQRIVKLTGNELQVDEVGMLKGSFVRGQ
ncbi:MAG: hypothetical protein Q7W02_10770 [Candidatus Rokubacteria bacterium]|nr:hypothetical protein [Candidatus Rokubacteria bacterium]